MSQCQDLQQSPFHVIRWVGWIVGRDPNHQNAAPISNQIPIWKSELTAGGDGAQPMSTHEHRDPPNENTEATGGWSECLNQGWMKTAELWSSRTDRQLLANQPGMVGDSGQAGSSCDGQTICTDSCLWFDAVQLCRAKVIMAAHTRSRIWWKISGPWLTPPPSSIAHLSRAHPINSSFLQLWCACYALTPSQSFGLQLLLVSGVW